MTKEVAYIKAALNEAIESLQLLEAHSDIIAEAGKMMSDSLAAGGKILFCGNGGSAADAQHLAAELMGRFLKERTPLAALALTVDTSAITAIGNDYGYEYIFERQLRGVGRKGDVLIGISTSGGSKNVVLALQAARERGIATIGLTGPKGGAMEEFCDLMIKVPGKRTDFIQQLHIVVGHTLCGLVEESL